MGILSRPAVSVLAVTTVALTALCAPTAARGALDVRSATVRISSTHRSSFRFVGEFAALSLAGAEYVAVQFDRFAFVLPIDAFKQRRGTYTYRGEKGVPGLRQLRLDTRKRRFAASGRDLALGGMANPTSFQLVTDTSGECAMVRFARHDGRRAKSAVRLVLDGMLGACDIPQGPSLEPSNLFVGEPTDVRIQVVIPASVAVQPDSVRVFRVGDDGRPEGEAVCTLRDDGNGAQGDDAAGDGVFSCVISIHESTPASIALVVQADSGDQRLFSPATTLRSVVAQGDADVQTVLAVQNAAGQIWTEQRAALGDTMAARVATIAALVGRPDVHDAVLATDQRSIEVELASGVTVFLLLAPRTVGAAALGPGGALVGRPAALVRAAGRLVPQATHRAGLTRVTNTAALVFDPGQLWFPEEFNEAADIYETFANSVCPKFQPTIVRGRAATLSALRTMAQYGTFAESSHGGVDSRDRVIVMTGEEATESAIRENFRALQLRDLTVVPSASILPAISAENPYDGVIAVRPPFVTGLAGRFDNAIIYLSSCYSQFNGTLTGAFLGKGAAAVLGYDIAVSTQYASSIGRQLFGSLVDAFATSGEAYDTAQPKIDFLPAGGSRDLVLVPPQPTATTRVRQGARFLMAGSRNVAYLGEPTLSPEASDVPANGTVTLTAEMPGTESCDLLYHWLLVTQDYNGYLSGGDEHESVENTVTYVAADPLIGGTDTVRVEIFALAGDGRREKLGEAEALVTVHPGP